MQDHLFSEPIIEMITKRQYRKVRCLGYDEKSDVGMLAARNVHALRSPCAAWMHGDTDLSTIDISQSSEALFIRLEPMSVYSNADGWNNTASVILNNMPSRDKDAIANMKGGANSRSTA